MKRLIDFRALASAVAIALTAPACATAADLYRPGNWTAMASDRLAQHPGDSLTVVIYENSTAVNSAQNGSRRNNRLAGQLRAGSSDQSFAGELGGNFDATAQTGRTGKLVAQISVTVDSVLPNGDLQIAGEQVLNINGERTRIRLKGRVRRADLANDNTVLSTRLADAAIDYDGTGFVSRRSEPGAVNRIITWLGLP